METEKRSDSELIREINQLKQKIITLEQQKTVGKQAILTARESERRYRTIFETTGTATVIIEQDRTIFLVNKEFELLSGYSKADIEGKMRWSQFVHPDDLNRMQSYHQNRRVDSDSAPRNYEFKFLDRAGETHQIYLTIAMIPGTTQSVASLLDITERKRMEIALKESEERYHTLFDQALDAILLENREMNILDANKSASELLGFSRAELLQMKTIDLAPKNLRKESHLIIYTNPDAVLDQPIETAIVTKSGNRIPVELTLTAFKTNGQSIFLSIIRNISARKKAEAEREQLITELKAALAEVETLSGLMPICSYCKKVRDDQGYWKQVEAYIAAHSSVEFTHSICPDCANNLFTHYQIDKE